MVKFMTFILAEKLDQRLLVMEVVGETTSPFPPFYLDHLVKSSPSRLVWNHFKKLGLNLPEGWTNPSSLFFAPMPE